MDFVFHGSRRSLLMATPAALDGVCDRSMAVFGLTIGVFARPGLEKTMGVCGLAGLSTFGRIEDLSEVASVPVELRPKSGSLS